MSREGQSSKRAARAVGEAMRAPPPPPPPAPPPPPPRPPRRSPPAPPAAWLLVTLLSLLVLLLWTPECKCLSICMRNRRYIADDGEDTYAARRTPTDYQLQGGDILPMKPIHWRSPTLHAAESSQTQSAASSATSHWSKQTSWSSQGFVAGGSQSTYSSSVGSGSQYSGITGSKTAYITSTGGGRGYSASVVGNNRYTATLAEGNGYVSSEGKGRTLNNPRGNDNTYYTTIGGGSKYITSTSGDSKSIASGGGTTYPTSTGDGSRYGISIDREGGYMRDGETKVSTSMAAGNDFTTSTGTSKYILSIGGGSGFASSTGGGSGSVISTGGERKYTTLTGDDNIPSTGGESLHSHTTSNGNGNHYATFKGEGGENTDGGSGYMIYTEGGDRITASTDVGSMYKISPNIDIKTGGRGVTTKESGSNYITSTGSAFNHPIGGCGRDTTFTGSGRDYGLGGRRTFISENGGSEHMKSTVGDGERTTSTFTDWGSGNTVFTGNGIKYSTSTGGSSKLSASTGSDIEDTISTGGGRGDGNYLGGGNEYATPAGHGHVYSTSTGSRIKGTSDTGGEIRDSTIAGGGRGHGTFPGVDIADITVTGGGGESAISRVTESRYDPLIVSETDVSQDGTSRVGKSEYSASTDGESNYSPGAGGKTRQIITGGGSGYGISTFSGSGYDTYKGGGNEVGTSTDSGNGFGTSTGDRIDLATPTSGGNGYGTSTVGESGYFTSTSGYGTIKGDGMELAGDESGCGSSTGGGIVLDTSKGSGSGHGTSTGGEGSGYDSSTGEGIGLDISTSGGSRGEGSRDASSTGGGIGLDTSIGGGSGYGTSTGNRIGLDTSTGVESGYGTFTGGGVELDTFTSGGSEYGTSTGGGIRLDISTGGRSAYGTSTGGGIGLDTSTGGVSSYGTSIGGGVKLDTSTSSGSGFGTSTDSEIRLHTSTSSGSGYGTSTGGEIGLDTSTGGGSGYGTSTYSEIRLHTSTSSGSGYGTSTGGEIGLDTSTSGGSVYGSSTNGGIGLDTSTGGGVELDTSTSSGSGYGTSKGSEIGLDASTGGGSGYKTSTSDGVQLDTSTSGGSGYETSTGGGVELDIPTSGESGYGTSTGGGVELDTSISSGIGYRTPTSGEIGLDTSTGGGSGYKTSTSDGVQLDTSTSGGSGYETSTGGGVELDIPTSGGSGYGTSTGGGIELDTSTGGESGYKISTSDGVQLDTSTSGGSGYETSTGGGVELDIPTSGGSGYGTSTGGGVELDTSTSDGSRYGTSTGGGVELDIPTSGGSGYGTSTGGGIELDTSTGGESGYGTSTGGGVELDTSTSGGSRYGISTSGGIGLVTSTGVRSGYGISTGGEVDLETSISGGSGYGSFTSGGIGLDTTTGGGVELDTSTSGGSGYGAHSLVGSGYRTYTGGGNEYDISTGGRNGLDISTATGSGYGTSLGDRKGYVSSLSVGSEYRTSTDSGGGHGTSSVGMSRDTTITANGRSNDGSRGGGSEHTSSVVGERGDGTTADVRSGYGTSIGDGTEFSISTGVRSKYSGSTVGGSGYDISTSGGSGCATSTGGGKEYFLSTGGAGGSSSFIGDGSVPGTSIGSGSGFDITGGGRVSISPTDVGGGWGTAGGGSGYATATGDGNRYGYSTGGRGGYGSSTDFGSGYSTSLGDGSGYGTSSGGGSVYTTSTGDESEYGTSTGGGSVYSTSGDGLTDNSSTRDRNGNAIIGDIGSRGGILTSGKCGYVTSIGDGNGYGNGKLTTNGGESVDISSTAGNSDYAIATAGMIESTRDGSTYGFSTGGSNAFSSSKVGESKDTLSTGSGFEHNTFTSGGIGPVTATDVVSPYATSLGDGSGHAISTDGNEPIRSMGCESGNKSPNSMLGDSTYTLSTGEGSGYNLFIGKNVSPDNFGDGNIAPSDSVTSSGILQFDSGTTSLSAGSETGLSSARSEGCDCATTTDGDEVIQLIASVLNDSDVQGIVREAGTIGHKHIAVIEKDSHTTIRKGPSCAHGEMVIEKDTKVRTKFLNPPYISIPESNSRVVITKNDDISGLSNVYQGQLSDVGESDVFTELEKNSEMILVPSHSDDRQADRNQNVGETYYQSKKHTNDLSKSCVSKIGADHEAVFMLERSKMDNDNKEGGKLRAEDYPNNEGLNWETQHQNRGAISVILNSTPMEEAKGMPATVKLREQKGNNGVHPVNTYGITIKNHETIAGKDREIFEESIVPEYEVVGAAGGEEQIDYLFDAKGEIREKEHVVKVDEIIDVEETEKEKMKINKHVPETEDELEMREVEITQMMASEIETTPIKEELVQKHPGYVSKEKDFGGAELVTEERGSSHKEVVKDTLENPSTYDIMERKEKIVQINDAEIDVSRETDEVAEIDNSYNEKITKVTDEQINYESDTKETNMMGKDDRAIFDYQRKTERIRNDDVRKSEVQDAIELEDSVVGKFQTQINDGENVKFSVIPSEEKTDDSTVIIEKVLEEITERLQENEAKKLRIQITENEKAGEESHENDGVIDGKERDSYKNRVVNEVAENVEDHVFEENLAMGNKIEKNKVVQVDGTSAKEGEDEFIREVTEHYEMGEGDVAEETKLEEGVSNGTGADDGVIRTVKDGIVHEYNKDITEANEHLERKSSLIEIQDKEIESRTIEEFLVSTESKRPMEIIKDIVVEDDIRSATTNENPSEMMFENEKIVDDINEFNEAVTSNKEVGIKSKVANQETNLEPLRSVKTLYINPRATVQSYEITKEPLITTHTQEDKIEDVNCGVRTVPNIAVVSSIKASTKDNGNYDQIESDIDEVVDPLTINHRIHKIYNNEAAKTLMCSSPQIDEELHQQSEGAFKDCDSMYLPSEQIHTSVSGYNYRTSKTKAVDQSRVPLESYFPKIYTIQKHEEDPKIYNTHITQSNLPEETHNEEEIINVQKEKIGSFIVSDFSGKITGTKMTTQIGKSQGRDYLEVESLFEESPYQEDHTTQYNIGTTTGDHSVVLMNEKFSNSSLQLQKQSSLRALGSINIWPEGETYFNSFDFEKSVPQKKETCIELSRFLDSATEVVIVPGLVGDGSNGEYYKEDHICFPINYFMDKTGRFEPKLKDNINIWSLLSRHPYYYNKYSDILKKSKQSRKENVNTQVTSGTSFDINTWNKKDVLGAIEDDSSPYQMPKGCTCEQCRKYGDMEVLYSYGKPSFYTISPTQQCPCCTSSLKKDKT